MHLSESSQHIGIYLPCTSPSRWITEGDEMTKILTNQGYKVELFYAEKDVDLQISQITNGITDGEDAMIISAVDPTKMGDVIKQASDKGIKIIAYDKFIDSAYINYFVSFDSTLIGNMQGKSLVDGLRGSGDPPYNVELFAGCNADSNAIYFYEGAMNILEPLIDTGEIRVLSGETKFDDISLEFQNSDYAAQRLQRLLDSYYKTNHLDGVLSPNDMTSLKIIGFIDKYEDLNKGRYPIITGQDGELNSIIAITNSKQYSTIFKDSKLLSQIASSMVIAVLNDETPEINDSWPLGNGTGSIPSFLCEPVLITKENYKSILIDSGHIKYEDVFPDTN